VGDEVVGSSINAQLEQKSVGSHLTDKPSTSGLVAHINTIFCEICSKDFSGDNAAFSLWKHQKTCPPPVGSNPDKYTCETCGKEYTGRHAKKNLKSHIQLHAESGGRVTPAICEICGKSFQGAYGKKNLKRHLTTHAGLRPFPCSICPMRFNQKSTKVTHERSIHGIEAKK